MKEAKQTNTACCSKRVAPGYTKLEAFGGLCSNGLGHVCQGWELSETGPEFRIGGHNKKGS